jgi:hypothetical protein
MAGGVASAEALTPELKAGLYEVGERRGHYQAFLILLSHERRWADARNLYPKIGVPALLNIWRAGLGACRAARTHSGAHSEG